MLPSFNSFTWKLHQPGKLDYALHERTQCESAQCNVRDILILPFRWVQFCEITVEWSRSTQPWSNPRKSLGRRRTYIKTKEETSSLLVAPIKSWPLQALVGSNMGPKCFLKRLYGPMDGRSDPLIEMQGCIYRNMSLLTSTLDVCNALRFYNIKLILDVKELSFHIT